MSLAERVRAAAGLDYDARRAEERALAAAAVGRVGELMALWDDQDARVRRTLIEVLRRAAGDDPAAGAAIAARLAVEPDVKARRRIAAALADGAVPGAAELLWAQLSREDHRFVQASIVLALGGLAFDGWTPAWRARTGEPGPVGEALRKALVRAGGGAPAAVAVVPRPRADYVVDSYEGAEAWVVDELARHGVRAVRAGGGLTIARAPDPAVLAALRTAVADYAIAGDAGASDVWGETLAAAARAIGGGGALRFRLRLPATVGRQRYRKLVTRVAREVERGSGWRNDTSHPEIELRVVELPSGPQVVWRGVGWARPEQAREAVPASAHPSVAAGLCLAAGVRPGAVLVEPCCGAGTIAREWRALGGRCALAADASARALAVAAGNLGDGAALARADLGALPVRDGVADAVIANLPFGIRVKHAESNRSLYRRFAEEARRVVRAGGVIVAYTGDGRALAEALPGAARVATVAAGGLQVGAFRYVTG